MQDVEYIRAQAKAYRAAAATAPTRKIYELLLELAAEFDNAAVKVEAESKTGWGTPHSGNG